MEDGTVVRGLAGVPEDGPVLLVGNHMLLGIELTLLPRSSCGIRRSWSMASRTRCCSRRRRRHGRRDTIYSTSSTCGEGEEHRIFWPEQIEFVRMAAQCNATIVPFGVVGEDDIVNERAILEGDNEGLQDAKHEVIFPGVCMKIPGRFYYRFGKPIPMRGRQDVLTDRRAATVLYAHIKSEVKGIISYLLEKREEDEYRKISRRLMFMASQGFNTQVPLFDPGHTLVATWNENVATEFSFFDLYAK
ncbi:hypothetical protein VPH35_134832 [Triticum aestivum]